MVSCEVFDVDLRFASRIGNAMSDEEVFSPYNYAKLREIIEPRLERPFHNEGISDHDVGRVEGQQRPCETDRNDA